MQARAVVVLSVAALLALLPPTPPATAAACPPASTGGRAEAWISIDGTRTPLKPVTYEHGGALIPPATNRAGGITGKPVGATSGTTIITWHVRYGPGCPGRMNDLATAPIGREFTLIARGGKSVRMEITSRTAAKKGRYRPSWFRPGGPYQVTLLTCDDLRGGTYRATAVTLASPVGTGPAEGAPPPATSPSPPSP